MLYPLAHSQKRICYIEKMYPGTAIHNIGGIARIKGPIKLDILSNVILKVINRHSVLNLRLVEEHGEIQQYISQFSLPRISQFDFSNSDDSGLKLYEWAKHEFSIPFNLFGDEPLFYFAVFKVSEKDNGYLMKLHHIIADGWSINLIATQIYELYAKFIKHVDETDVSDESYNYLDYLDHEIKYLKSDRFNNSKDFWLDKFTPLPEIQHISGDNLVSKRKSFYFDHIKSRMIHQLASENGTSLTTIFVSLMLLYLSKTRQQEDIVIGIPILNRTGKKEKSIVGMFTSTMPFRFLVRDNYSIKTFIFAVKKELKRCYYHQKYPYDQLVQDLALRQKGVDTFFDVSVNYYNTKLTNDLLGYPIHSSEINNGNQLFSLQVVINEWDDDGISLNLDYKVKDYSEQQIQILYERLCYFIQQCTSDSELLLRDITLINQQEQDRLIFAFNETTRNFDNKTIVQLFEEQVYRFPNRIAVDHNSCYVSYEQLNARATQIAKLLISRKLAKNSIVALSFTHSIDLVASIIGVLKAQCAYVPIDPNLPIERINYILRDSQAVLFLTNVNLQELRFGGEIIHVDDQVLEELIEFNNSRSAQLSDLAYLIYTSGSTGYPKGVMIRHHSLANYVRWARDMYIRSSDEAFALYSSISFDLTVTSIFTPLINGNKIIIYNDETDGDEFILDNILRENKVAILKLTPAHLSLLADRKFPSSSIKRFIVGGDNLHTKLCRKIYDNFGGNVEIYNEYGPTEATVGCMLHKYDVNHDYGVSVSIGVPAYNTKIYLLDKDLKPVPVGMRGEIYIGGAGVSAGYINQLELTTRCFIPSPFLERDVIYKTGDLAKHLDNGAIEYVGRVDRQVKLNGFRIELGEIEQVLLRNNNINAAFVTDFNNKNSSKYICAYLTVKHNMSIHEIKEYLSKYFPASMLPAYFFILDKLPLTANGKIDTLSLPEFKFDVSMDKVNRQPTEIEKDLLAAIKKILDLETVDLRDNFFYLGGDSIKAIQLSSMLKEKCLTLKVKDILSLPVIEEMATKIVKNTKLDFTNHIIYEKDIGILPIIAWFFSREFSNPNYFHQSIFLRMSQDITLAIIEKVLERVILCYSTFRINYDSKLNKLFYRQGDIFASSLVKEYDLSSYNVSEQKLLIKKHGTELKSSICLESNSLFAACFFNLGEKEGKRLLLVAHHLIIDGVSWRILLEDISTLIKNKAYEQSASFLQETASLQQWAEVIKNYSDHEAVIERPFWEKMCNNNFHFPIDFNKGEELEKYKDTKVEFLSKDDTKILLGDANKSYNTKPNELLIIGLSLALSDYLARDEVVIELEGHGRESINDSIDLSRTIGWFTSIYPVKLVKQGFHLGIQIKSFKDQLRKVPSGGLSFGVLKYLNHFFDASMPTQVRFNYLGEFDNSFKHTFFELAEEDSGLDISVDNKMTALLDIVALVVNGKLKLMLSYNTNKFKSITISTFLTLYLDKLRKILHHCLNKKETELTPSDFALVNLTQTEIDGIFDEQ